MSALLFKAERRPATYSCPVLDERACTILLNTLYFKHYGDVRNRSVDSTVNDEDRQCPRQIDSKSINAKPNFFLLVFLFSSP